ncbi:MAG: hypothetical protein QOG67_2532 [Verrucomicrobiota bacterium]|jgi:hypothetical protein
MSDTAGQTLEAIREIRDLIRLMAEPQIAARDQKYRDELIRLVGKSDQKAQAVFLMDGNHTQAQIHAKTKVHRGNLSTLIKELNKVGLLSGDPKQPKLTITIPTDFFEKAKAQ